MRYTLFFFTFGLALIFFSGQGPTMGASAKSTFISPPQSTKYFSFGYDESVADSIWLRVIQDIDYCDKKAIGGDTPVDQVNLHPEAVDGAGLIKPGGYRLNDKSKCRDESWVFTMLDAVTRLAPRFRIPYTVGGTLLSVVVRDYGGSSIIFDRGVKQFPGDWQLEYKAAFHYLYDMDDKKRAAELLIEAANNGGPKWLYSLAAKLYTTEGQAFLAKTVLQQILDRDPDARFAERLKARLKEAEDALAQQQEAGSAAPNSLLPAAATIAKPLDLGVPKSSGNYQ